MNLHKGSPVIIRDKNLRSNGQDEHAAIVTRVWGADTDTRNGPVMVNTMVLPDAGVPKPVTSVKVYDTKEEADASPDLFVGWLPSDADR